MTVFWIVAGLLMAGALLFVLPPLLGRRPISGGASHGQVNLNIYRDQLRELDRDLEMEVIAREQYEASRREIEKRVLEESAEASDAPAPAQVQWTLVSVVGVLLPAMAIGLYLTLGTPAALTGKDSPSADDASHAMTPERIEGMVRNLAERLKANPEDGEGWLMLAKSYGAMGRFGEASEAYAQALKRLPPDAQVLADYADALAMAQGRSLAGEPERLIEQALKADPQNVKALALAGTVAYSKQDFKKAIEFWQRILPLVPPESDLAQRLQGSIADAQARAGGAAAGAAKVAKAPAGAAAAVSGRITLSPEAAKAVQPGDTVFVFARAAQGPRMPIAIFRTQVGSLPTEFRLDDSMGLSADRKLSQSGEVLIGARVSRSGSATPSQGDWESSLVPAKPGVSDVQLAIDRPYKG